MLTLSSVSRPGLLNPQVSIKERWRRENLKHLFLKDVNPKKTLQLAFGAEVNVNKNTNSNI